MERQTEIAKLVNVLHKTARMATQAEMTGFGQDSAAHCVEQFNRVLARFRELDPGVVTVFEPLAPGSSLSVAAMACRQLAAYYEDEAGRPYGVSFDARVFKDFWCKAGREFEDLGDFIRESVEHWARTRKPKAEGEKQE